MLPRFSIITFACLLAGCLSTRPSDIKLVEPEIKKVTVADTAGDLDALAMSYAAASVTAVKESITAGSYSNASKELDVALANLIRPQLDHLISARARVKVNDDNAYQIAIRKAEQLQRKSDEAWAAFEIEKGKNDLLDRQLSARQIEADARARQDRLDNVASKCTWLGGILIVAGVLSFALGSYLPINKLSGPICLSVGAGLIALPLVLTQLLDWPYLSPVVMSTVLVILAIFVWHWWSAHRNCNA